MKCHVFLLVVCVPVIYSAPTSNSARTSAEPSTHNAGMSAGTLANPVKRAAQTMDTVSFFEIHDLTGVEHDDLPDDIQPFEIVNIDGHTAHTLPKDIIPVEIISAQNSAEVFEVHNLDGVSPDDIPDDVSIFEVVDLSGHTVDTLPADVFPVHIAPLGTAAGASAISTQQGSAVLASAMSGFNMPGEVVRSGMSRVEVVPSSHISHAMHLVDGRAPKYVTPTVRAPHSGQVKCRQTDLFPFRGPSEGLFKYFSGLLREELSDCMVGGMIVARR